MNGTTVYSAFNISVCKPGKQFCHRNHQMRSCMKKCHLFKYLNAIMLHRVSMLGTKMFEYLNISLQDIKAMPKVFGGISLILSGDLLQLLAI